MSVAAIRLAIILPVSAFLVVTCSYGLLNKGLSGDASDETAGFQEGDCVQVFGEGPRATVVSRKRDGWAYTIWFPDRASKEDFRKEQLALCDPA